MTSGSGPSSARRSSTSCSDLLRDLFTRYGGAEGDAFRLAVACYPNLPRQTDVARDLATSTDVAPDIATNTEGDSDDRAE